MRRLSDSGSLVLRLLAAYLAATFGGSLFIVLNNLVIHNASLRGLMRFNIPFVLASDLILTMVLFGASWFRLRPALRGADGPGEAAEQERERIFLRLAVFPNELFRAMLLLSLLFMGAYHATEWMTGRRALGTAAEIVGLVQTVISELSLALILSVLLHYAARRLLRREAAKLMVERAAGFAMHSAARMIAVIAAIGFVITFGAASRIILYTREEAFPLARFLLISGIYSAFAIAAMWLYIAEFRRELRLVGQSLHALSAGDRSSLHRRIPLVSLDETGRMTEALNDLQRRIEAAHEEIGRQMRLSYAVQRKLLPRAFPAVEGLEAAAYCSQCQEVGGDFYDLIPLGDDRYCVAIGDVSGKGPSAALLMTAAMAGLRAAARKERTAGGILTVLNRHMYAMTQGRYYVTAGLAIVDLSSGSAELEYASAGHLDPYVVRGGQVMELQHSSYPLGAAPGTVYHGARNTLEPGDSLVLYTDGVIETKQHSGQLLGFEWWEQQLRLLASDLPLNLLLAELIGQVERIEYGEPADDRTLLLLRWSGRGMEVARGEQEPAV